MRSSARAAPGAAAARPVGDNAKGLAAWRPAAPPGGLPGGWTKEKAVLSDLAVLTPPLVVCAALLIAIGAFLRHEMGGRGQHGDDPPSSDIPVIGQISDPGIGEPAASPDAGTANDPPG